MTSHQTQSNKIHGAIEFFWQKFCPAKNFLSKLKEVLSASFLMACIRAINIPNDIYSNLTLTDKIFRNSIFIFYIYCKKKIEEITHQTTAFQFQVYSSVFKAIPWNADHK